MGKGRKSQLLSESLARRAEQEMAMAEQAGSIAVAVQGERTEKQITKQKEKEKKDKAASEPQQAQDRTE
jgi:predicted GIY-YIG superfamily endonuclease